MLLVESLKSRRTKICLKFALQAQKSERFSKWFAFNNHARPGMKTRTKLTHTFKPVNTRTRRYLRSPIPYLTNLLNEHFDKSAREQS